MARPKKITAVPVEQTVEPIAVVETTPAPFTITNDTPGSTLHLGDGRRLAFGESVVVSQELYRAIKGDDE